MLEKLKKSLISHMVQAAESKMKYLWIALHNKFMMSPNAAKLIPSLQRQNLGQFDNENMVF